MWVRKCDLDAQAEAPPPIPTRIVSNEEFIPIPPTPQQKQLEARIAALSEEGAKAHGVSRRDFLRGGAGMAAALLAINQVYGEVYEVSADEVKDPKAFEEKRPKKQFIFDVQTHHVDISQKWYDTTKDGQVVRSFFTMLRPGAKSPKEALEQLNRAHYVKELFGDSDTVMAIISGVPSRTWEKNPLPPDQMVATRKYVNDLAGGSRRVLSHGLVRPNLDQKKELEEMERQVKKLKVDAWKFYTGAELGEKAWRLDDEKVAYPFWELTKKLGVKNVCVHKGLPLSAFNEKACLPDDVEKAAKDFPELNFIIYHSAYRGPGGLAGSWVSRGTGERVKDKPTKDPQEIPWISDLLRILKNNPKIKNVYFELGSTFNMLSSAAPASCLHMLGQMIQVAGEDHILWGTDSIWNGSPQGQIDRLRRMKMTDELMKKHKYAELTDKVKDKILGLNAAKVFGIDPKAEWKRIKTDKLTKLKEEYRKSPAPSNTQYGWVWVGKGKPTAPVGEA